MFLRPCLPVCAALLCAAAPTAHAALQVSLAGPKYVRIPYGGSADIGLVARNTGDAALPAFHFESSTGPTPEFTVADAPGTQCGPLTDSAYPNGVRVPVPSLAPGEQRECRIRFTRSAVAAGGNDYSIWHAVDGSGALLLPWEDHLETHAGSFADLALSSEQLTFDIDAQGIATAINRVTVRNLGPDAVGGPHAATTCGFESTVYEFDVDLPGGCAGPIGNFCHFMLPGASIPLPGVAAGESHSCLVRMRSRAAYTAPAALVFQTSVDHQAPQGGWMVDYTGANNSASLRIGPLPAGVAPTVMPMLDGRSLALLALALMGIAWFGLRARRARD